DALTGCPCGDVVADCIDASRYLMTWHAWILKPWPEAVFDEHVAVANAACLDFHAHLAGSRFGNIALHQFPIATCLAYLCGFHFRAHYWSSRLITLWAYCECYVLPFRTTAPKRSA